MLYRIRRGIKPHRPVEVESACKSHVDFSSWLQAQPVSRLPVRSASCIISNPTLVPGTWHLVPGTFPHLLKLAATFLEVPGMSPSRTLAPETTSTIQSLEVSVSVSLLFSPPVPCRVQFLLSQGDEPMDKPSSRSRLCLW